MKKLLMWDITSKCNLRCKHCYNWELLKSNTDQMDLEKCLNFINKLPTDTHIHILGGEPFMKDNFMEIIKYLNTKQNTYSIVTNGTLLNKEVIHTLVQSNMTSIIFSLDGPNEITHEQIRGENTFYRLLDNISLFKKTVHKHKKNINITVNITINKFNYNLIDRFYNLLELLMVDEVVFNNTSEEGNAANNNLCITPELWVDTCEKIAIHSINSKVSTILYAKPLLLSYLNTRYNSNFQLDTLNCGLIDNKILMYVNNNGSVYPCNKWEKIKDIYGNKINTSVENMTADDIKTYSTKNIMQKEIIDLIPQTENHRKGLCKQCRVKNYCSGCILDLHQNNELFDTVSDCFEASLRINEYKDTLLDMKYFKIKDNLNIDYDKDNITINNIETNKKIILKNRIKNILIDIHKNNIENINSLDKKTQKQCVYELKRLKIIEERRSM